MTVARIAKVVREAPGYVPGTSDWLSGLPCEGSKFHSPRHLVVRPHYLTNEVSLHAQDDTLLLDGDLVHLCGTCADNLSVYLTILVAYDGATPHTVRRDFGNGIRALGDRAWAHHLKRSPTDPV
jgi:hypothetical protein